MIKRQPAWAMQLMLPLPGPPPFLTQCCLWNGLFPLQLEYRDPQSGVLIV